jgi:hypothetical protein
MGQGRGGSYTVGIGCSQSGGLYVCTDSFTYEVPNAMFPSPPGQGMMKYIGNTARIVSGTGKFKFASGNLNVAGPAIAWPLTSAPDGPWAGNWNGELSGQVCGVQ